MKNILIVFILIIAFSCKEKAKDISAEKVIEDVSAVEFKKLIDAGNVQLVDVRTPQEFELGFIPNAKLINVNEDNFSSEASKLDKSKPVLVYCKSGGRSARAAKMLEEFGFTKIYNLEGGFTAWQEKKFEKSAYK